MNNDDLLPHLLNQINRFSLPAKLKAIDLLSESEWAKEPVVVERLEKWRRILPHPTLKSAIHLYFARHALLRPEKIMNDLHNEHLGLQAAAILSLKTTPYQSQLPSFLTLASEKLRLLLDSKIEREICTGLEILGYEKNSENLEVIFSYLKHPALNVTLAAAKALAHVASPDCKEFAPQIIERLFSTRDPQVRHYYLQALEKMQDQDSIRELILATIHFRPNERALVERFILEISNQQNAPTLLELVQDRFIHERCRLLAGKLLAKRDLNLLKNHLFSLAQKEIERAYFYFYHAKTIQKQIPEYDLLILENALETGYHSVIDFVIQLLGAANSIDESEILSHTLRSKNRKLRAQAIETLQKACSTRLFTLLEPLIDERPLEQKLRYYLKKGHIPLNLTQLLDTMVYSPSLTDQIVAIGLKAKLDAPGWREVVKKKLQSNEEIFEHFAHELLETTA